MLVVNEITTFIDEVKEFCKKHSLDETKAAKLLKIVKMQLKEMAYEVEGNDSSLNVSSMSMIQGRSPNK